jgi:hypothetical protein
MESCQKIVSDTKNIFITEQKSANYGLPDSVINHFYHILSWFALYKEEKADN